MCDRFMQKNPEIFSFFRYRIFPKIYVNLRPTTEISYIKGIGDNASISGVEAVKGADKPITDDYTVAYWPFNEGQGAIASSLIGSFTGNIEPSPVWSDGRSDSNEMDTSVLFDGLFTKITTDVELSTTEFTGEVWFKTSSSNAMVNFSDKKVFG